jgi:cyanate permease
MRNIWATIFATWALFGVLAILAWTRPQPTNSPQAVPTAVVVKGKNGKSQIVVVQSPSSASHATTRTSPVPAG